MAQSLIFHVDLDCFYVAAERLKDPTLIGIPVAVGGTGKRSVLSAASYEARKYGVRSALPTSIALERCPQLKIIYPDFTHYSKLSEKVFSILENYSPIIEKMGADEGYLEMTGSQIMFGDPETAAKKIRAEILKDTGLAISIGMGANKLVSKVATDFCKPNGFCYVKPGSEADFLAPLLVEKLPFCGAATLKWLHQREIKTIGDLQRFPKKILETKLGSHGIYLHDAAFGRGSTNLEEVALNKSISREITYGRDICDIEQFRKIIWQMCDELSQELRQGDQLAKTVRLKLRYPPFETVTRSRTNGEPTDKTQALFETAFKLFAENWEYPNPLRLIGVGFVVVDKPEQLNLFDQPNNSEDQPKAKSIDTIRDEIRARFGEGAIKLGREII